MQHYITSIILRGSADRFSTESPERLHIDFAKSAYCTTNKKNCIKQMTKWLTRQDTCHRFSSYLQWVAPGYISEVTVISEMHMVDDDEEVDEDEEGNSDQTQSLGYSIAKNPSYPHLSINSLIADFGAVDFLPCLINFLCTSPFTLHSARIPVLATTLPVHKQFTIYIPPAPQVTKLVNKDIIHAQHAVSARGPLVPYLLNSTPFLPENQTNISK